ARLHRSVANVELYIQPANTFDPGIADDASETHGRIVVPHIGQLLRPEHDRGYGIVGAKLLNSRLHQARCRRSRKGDARQLRSRAGQARLSAFRVVECDAIAVLVYEEVGVEVSVAVG